MNYLGPLVKVAQDNGKLCALIDRYARVCRNHIS